MSEFDKLVMMLDDAKIPYERHDSNFFSAHDMQRIKYPSGENQVCSCVFGYGSYGYERDLLEIMGLLTPEEKECDDVAGYLTADDVFNRINRHYLESQSNEEQRMTCKYCIHTGLCYKENDYNSFPDRCGDFISDKTLEEKPTGEWIPIEKEDDLIDHYWYLVVHEDYKTPIKAKYHSDVPHFTFSANGKEHASYIFEGKITHYMDLPELPKEVENDS